MYVCILGSVVMAWFFLFFLCPNYIICMQDIIWCIFRCSIYLTVVPVYYYTIAFLDIILGRKYWWWGIVILSFTCFFYCDYVLVFWWFYFVLPLFVSFAFHH